MVEEARQIGIAPTLSLDDSLVINIAAFVNRAPWIFRISKRPVHLVVALRSYDPNDQDGGVRDLTYQVDLSP